MDNQWISYITRSYQQIKDDVLTRAQSLVPEITDHTESNLYTKMIGIWSALTEMLGYYIDNMARESLVVSARIYSNMISHAFANDYQVHSKVAATVDLRFYIPTSVGTDQTIPIGTEVKTTDGVIFYTTEVGVITAGETEVYVKALQGTVVNSIVLAALAGTPNEIIELPSADTAANSVVLTIDSVAWTGQETLAYSIATDKHFIQTVGVDRNPILRLGDGFNGMVGNPSDSVQIDYVDTLGEFGNAASGSINIIVTSLSISNLAVVNPNKASNGSDFETIAELKHRIPRNKRTLHRAVTRQDYVDITELVDGVAKAGVYFDCSSDIELFIVPTGGGSASTTLVQAAQTNIDLKRVLGRAVFVRGAGEVEVSLDITIKVLPQYQNILVIQALKDRLTEFISYRNQAIGGELQLSDVYEIIEGTTGVRHSQITVMSVRPYAIPITPTNIELSWVRDVQLQSNATIKWRIQMISGTTYQLFKDNAFIGVKTVGDTITLPEIVFTVSANSYVIGNEWTFVTYKYFGTIVLDEPSMLVSLENDINITATGGL